MISTDHELRRREKNTRLITQQSPTSNTLGPITGYAQEPVVSLDEACAPLTVLIDDILTYVSLALETTAKDPADGLNRDESAAIRLYTMEWPDSDKSVYAILNHTLKIADRKDLKPWYKYLKLFLTALVKIPCAPLQTVWRGVRKNISDEFLPGTRITWWSFSSCTTTLTVLENEIYLGNTGERTLFSIEIINGRNVVQHSYFDHEDEILLLPGTSMEVKSQFNPASDLHIIHLKQNIPEQILLELPFENACLYPKLERTPWYRKKRFFLPITILTVISIVAIVTGSILGSRFKNSTIDKSNKISKLATSQLNDGVWVDAENGEIPPNAIVGGKEDNCSVYMVRFKTLDGNMIPGKLVDKSKVAEGGYYGVRTSSTYQILTNPNSKRQFKWASTSSHQIPHGAFLAGYEQGNELYVGRVVQTADSIILGKYHARDGKLYYTQYGQEKNIDNNFEVLCIS